MKTRKGKFSVDGVLALVLFGVFALCVLAVLLQGAQAYRQMTERGQQSYDRRTAAQYIVTRVRQADAASAVGVTHGNPADVLELRETIDGTEYITRIYCHDGYLRELFSAAALPFEPASGEKILPAEDLELTWQNGLISAVITESGGEMTRLSVALRSGEVADHAE